jgi:AcrR family transcriptional regulator
VSERSLTYAGAVPPRAKPLSPDARRAALVAATVPLLTEHGRTLTTKQIADAAGIAEGTIFRVFESKDDLVMAAVEEALDIEPFLAELEGIDSDRALAAVLLDLVTRMQVRFRGIFTLMSAMGMVGPPRAHKHMEEGRRRAEALTVALLEPHRAELAVSPTELAKLVRLLTFSGSHPHLSDGRTLSPEEIVAVLLHGVLKKDF